MDRADVGELVQAAADGNAAAWKALMETLSPLVWGVVRAHRIPDADAHEVYQTVWFRFAQHMDRMPDPHRASTWLASTARHECLKVLKNLRRLAPTDEAQLLDRASDDYMSELVIDSEEAGTEAERIRILWEEFDQLGERCKQLLRLLMVEPPLSYNDISAALGIAVGSIGPIRQRCIRRLRARLDAQADFVGSRSSRSDRGLTGGPEPFVAIENVRFRGATPGAQNPVRPTAGSGSELPAVAGTGEGREVLPVPSAPPRCRTQVTLLDDNSRAGAPLRLAVTLVAESAHPWALPGARPPLEVVAVPLSRAEVAPAMALYGPGSTSSARFRFTAAEAGTHRIRFTFVHHDTGVVLQRVETDLHVADPEQPTALGKTWPGPRRGRS